MEIYHLEYLSCDIFPLSNSICNNRTANTNFLWIILVDSLEDVFVNVNEEEFKEKYGKSKPNKDFPLIFTCLMGGRAARAADIASKLGYKK